MKKVIAICAFLVFAMSCSSKKEGNMIVQGQIKGLKKGTLYLQKIKDTALVSVDSISLLGKDMFTLTDDVNSPEMYYLTFDGNKTEKRIVFFGEKGNITINDDVAKFGVNPEISGSKNQDILKDYFKLMNRLNNQNLDLIKENLDAQKEKNTKKIKEIEDKQIKLFKKRYLFATNFAINNSDAEVAPYIALTDLADANIKLLDTINVSLTKEIKTSKYGKQLQKYISDIKKTEQ